MLDDVIFEMFLLGFSRKLWPTVGTETLYRWFSSKRMLVVIMNVFFFTRPKNKKYFGYVEFEIL